MSSFDRLFGAHVWREIPGCLGRFRLVTPLPDRAPHELAGATTTASEHRVAGARDIVLVLPLEGGGLLSYRRPDGSYVHTLNTASGFARKLAALGIPAP